MTTALTYINRIRVMMREETITAIETSDDLTQDLLVNFNDAKDTILNDYRWKFRERDDGIAMFPRRYTGTSFNATQFSEVVTLDSQSNHTFYLGLGASRITISTDAFHPNQSFRIVTGNTVSGNTELELATLWLGDTGAATSPAWTTFAYEVPLPTTVGEVLSVRDEENDRQLEFVGKSIELDSVSPRLHDSFGLPDFVYVGGTITNTITTDDFSFSSGTTIQKEFDTLFGGRTHTRMAVWPIPQDDLFLRYTYNYLYPDVSLTADELLGIPRLIERIIIMSAFYALLAGNAESDSIRAKEIARAIELDLAKARRVDKRTPLRRRIVRPVDSLIGQHPNVRWSSRQVPSA